MLAACVLLITGVLPAVARGPAAARGVVAESRPVLRADKRQFSFAGKDLALVSGSLHYFRIPKAQWGAHIRLCKQAGLNCIETCVPWNYHQPQWQQAPLQHTRRLQLAELGEFLDMVHGAGLYSFVRIGPYVGAELAGGGLPGWLDSTVAGASGLPPHLLWRSAAEPNLAASAAWLEALLAVIKPRQIGRTAAGGGCVMVQIEQEYDFVELPPQDKRGYLQALLSQLRQGGLYVPINAALGREIVQLHDPLQLNLNTLNLYDRLDLASSRRKLGELALAQPERPLWVSELQTGWYTRVGGQLSQQQPGIGLDQLQGLVWTCLEQGVAGYNYSQFVGGSNFANMAGKGIAQSYDCFAPVAEGGFINEKYLWLQALHAWYRQHAYDMFATSRVEVKLPQCPPQLLVGLRKSLDGNYYVFVHNMQANRALDYRLEFPLENSVVLDWQLQLAPRQYELLRVSRTSLRGKTQRLVVEAGQGVYAGLQQKMSRQIACVAISQQVLPLRRLQQFAVSQKHLLEVLQGEFASLAANPELSQTRLHNRPALLYRSDFEMDAAAVALYRQLCLQLHSPARVQLWLNGRPLQAAQANAMQRCWELDDRARVGRNSLLILLECQSGGYWAEELLQKNGISELCLLARQRRIDLVDWHMQKVQNASEAESLLDADFSRWPRYKLDESNLARLNNSQIPPEKLAELAPLRDLWVEDSCSLYACEFDLAERQLEDELHWLNFSMLDDMAVVYLNGRKIAHNSRWDVPLRCNLLGLLKQGRNRLQVYVVNAGGKGGLLGGVYFDGNRPAGSMPLQLQVAAEQQNLSWYALLQQQQDWQDYLPLVASSADQPRTYLAHSPLVYYRASFSSPDTGRASRRVLLQLSSQGNGEIYLNGKALGRFWGIGPQQYFLLPYSWLRQDGTDNEVLLVSRAGSEGNELLDIGVVLQQQGVPATRHRARRQPSGNNSRP